MSESSERVKRYRERQKALQKADVTVGDVTVDVTLHGRPKEATDGQWALAVERAERARRYAAMFPDLIRPSEVVFQSAAWQFENEIRKRI